MKKGTAKTTRSEDRVAKRIERVFSVRGRNLSQLNPVGRIPKQGFVDVCNSYENDVDASPKRGKQ